MSYYITCHEFCNPLWLQGWHICYSHLSSGCLGQCSLFGSVSNTIFLLMDWLPPQGQRNYLMHSLQKEEKIHIFSKSISAEENVMKQAGIRTWLTSFSFKVFNHYTTCMFIEKKKNFFVLKIVVFLYNLFSFIWHIPGTNTFVQVSKCLNVY